MNKELVKEYKKEFEHWLNGGKLKVRPNNDKWFDVRDDTIWLMPNDIKIVINDEYVEFRKALAEGKTVQIKEHPSDGDGWYTPQSLKDGTHIFDETCTYRIEPIFKIGDWVRYRDKILGELKYKIKDEKELNEVIEINRVYSDETCTIWKPKVGEWVVKTEVNGKAGTYISGFEVLMWTEYDVYECEPFIGKLPSFLKENK